MILKDYPGAKNGSGIIPWLINEIPYHERYFELFAGSASVYFKKKPAAQNFLNDINPVVIKALTSSIGINDVIFNRPALELLRNPSITFSTADFIYLDPPYHKDDRRSGAKIYENEMLTDDDHIQLLIAIRDIKANVMISCGLNKLYNMHLKDWRKSEFETMGHRGKRVEVIYMNYPKPELLHQYDYLGKDYIERQALLRKKQRWEQLINRLPAHQKHVLIQEIIKNDKSAVQHFLSVLSGTDSYK